MTVLYDLDFFSFPFFSSLKDSIEEGRDEKREQGKLEKKTATVFTLTLEEIKVSFLFRSLLERKVWMK